MFAMCGTDKVVILQLLVYKLLCIALGINEIMFPISNGSFLRLFKKILPGETNLYRLYDEIDVGDREAKDLKAMYATQSLSLASSLFSGFQKFARKSFGVAVPLFTGRSIFFKSLGIMPHRRPVVVVVGKPIAPPELGCTDTVFAPKIDRKTDQPLNEHGKILIDWHAKYVGALEELYNEYKDAPWNSPGKLRQDSMKIVR